jgi:hypothetical protein
MAPSIQVLLPLIPFALNNPIQNAFIQFMGEIQVSISGITHTQEHKSIFISYNLYHRSPSYRLPCSEWYCLGQRDLSGHGFTMNDLLS